MNSHEQATVERINLVIAKTELLKQLSLTERIESHLRVSDGIFRFLHAPENKMLRVNDAKHYQHLDNMYKLNSSIAYLLIQEELDKRYRGAQ
jgi:hypothetical protein